MSKISFLVVVDGTDEMEVSLKYACIKAKKTNGHLILASFIKPIEILKFGCIKSAIFSIAVFMPSILITKLMVNNCKIHSVEEILK